VGSGKPVTLAPLGPASPDRGGERGEGGGGWGVEGDVREVGLGFSPPTHVSMNRFSPRSTSGQFCTCSNERTHDTRGRQLSGRHGLSPLGSLLNDENEHVVQYLEVAVAIPPSRIFLPKVYERVFESTFIRGLSENTLIT
jgi:hypothetical protein